MDMETLFGPLPPTPATEQVEKLNALSQAYEHDNAAYKIIKAQLELCKDKTPGDKLTQELHTRCHELSRRYREAQRTLLHVCIPTIEEILAAAEETFTEYEGVRAEHAKQPFLLLQKETASQIREYVKEMLFRLQCNGVPVGNFEALLQQRRMLDAWSELHYETHLSRIQAHTSGARSAAEFMYHQTTGRIEDFCNWTVRPELQKLSRTETYSEYASANGDRNKLQSLLSVNNWLPSFMTFSVLNNGAWLISTDKISFIAENIRARDRFGDYDKCTIRCFDNFVSTGAKFKIGVQGAWVETIEGNDTWIYQRDERLQMLLQSVEGDTFAMQGDGDIVRFFSMSKRCMIASLRSSPRHRVCLSQCCGAYCLYRTADKILVCELGTDSDPIELPWQAPPDLTGIALSRLGTRAMLGFREGTNNVIHVWDVPTRTLVLVMGPNPIMAGESLKFHNSITANGDHLLAMGWTKREARLLLFDIKVDDGKDMETDVQGTRVVRVVEQDDADRLGTACSHTLACQVSPDGTYAVLASRRGAYAWDLQATNRSRVLQLGKWSPAGTKLMPREMLIAVKGFLY